MATMSALPPTNVIMGLKGMIDFYVSRGSFCARTWPRKPSLPRSPAVTATMRRMTAFVAALRLQDIKLIDDGRYLARGTSWSWRDAAITAAYGHLTAP